MWAELVTKRIGLQHKIEHHEIHEIHEIRQNTKTDDN